MSDYEKLRPLTFCKNDAVSMIEILSSLKYEVKESANLLGFVRWQAMRDMIIEYFNDSNLRRDDTIVFYYSGHGLLDGDGDGYFAASETDPFLPRRRGFPFNELTQIMQDCVSIHKVAILDCCYSGSARIGKGSEYEMAKLGMVAMNKLSKILTQGEGICLLASSQSYQEAYKLEEEDHSLFTYFLLEGLKGNRDAVNNEGYVTVDSVSNFIYDKICQLPEEKRPKQKPVRKIEASGDIMLAFYPEFAKLNPPTSISIELPSVIEKGQEFMDKKDYQAALDYYETITRNSSLAQAWDNKGLALHKLGKNEEASKCFDICLGLDPTNPDCWEHKGGYLNNTGNNEGALACFTKSIIFTRSSDTNLSKCNRWFGKGVCLENKGLQNEAMACFKKSIELYPKAEYALWKVGDILVNQKNYEEAERYYNKSLEIDPDFPLALSSKGGLMQSQGKYLESISYFEKAIENAHKYKSIKNPESFQASIACSFVSLKKYELALDRLNKSLEINPRNIEVLKLKGLILQNVMQKYEDALKCFDAALAIDNNNTEIIDYKQKLLDMKVSNVTINWNEVKKKKVYGIDKYDLGVVQVVEADHILTGKGMLNREKFYLPKNLGERFDGHILWFGIRKDDAWKFRHS